MFPFRQEQRWIRLLLASIALLLFVCIYVLQDWGASLIVDLPISEKTRFVVAKTSRFLANDAACLLLIAALFNQRSHLRIGLLVFTLELTVILPLYFVLKLGLEGTSEISSPLLSQLHRMVVNPLLMFVLIAGLFVQQYSRRNLGKAENGKR